MNWAKGPRGVPVRPAVRRVLVLGEGARLPLPRRKRAEIVLIRRRVEFSRAIVVVAQRLVHLRASGRVRACVRADEARRAEVEGRGWM